MNKKYEVKVHYKNDDVETIIMRGADAEQIIDCIEARLIPIGYSINGAPYVRLVNADEIREIDMKSLDSEEDI